MSHMDEYGSPSDVTAEDVILARLGSLESRVQEVEGWIGNIQGRLTAVEVPATWMGRPFPQVFGDMQAELRRLAELAHPTVPTVHYDEFVKLATKVNSLEEHQLEGSTYVPATPIETTTLVERDYFGEAVKAANDAYRSGWLDSNTANRIPDDIDPISLVEHMRYREHSRILNQVMFQIHTAMGLNPDNADTFAAPDALESLPEIVRLVEQGMLMAKVRTDLDATLTGHPLVEVDHNPTVGHTPLAEDEGITYGGGNLDRRPHSRACGWTPHPHGTRCSTNCPTCHGVDIPHIYVANSGEYWYCRCGYFCVTWKDLMSHIDAGNAQDQPAPAGEVGPFDDESPYQGRAGDQGEVDEPLTYTNPKLKRKLKDNPQA